jgi:hypothetical protein
MSTQPNMEDGFVRHFLEIRIAEHYQLCKRLGADTFGLVYHRVFRTRSRGAGRGSRQGDFEGRSRGHPRCNKG